MLGLGRGAQPALTCIASRDSALPVPMFQRGRRCPLGTPKLPAGVIVPREQSRGCGGISGGVCGHEPCQPGGWQPAGAQVETEPGAASRPGVGRGGFLLGPQCTKILRAASPQNPPGPCRALRAPRLYARCREHAGHVLMSSPQFGLNVLYSRLRLSSGVLSPRRQANDSPSPEAVANVAFASAAPAGGRGQGAPEVDLPLAPQCSPMPPSNLLAAAASGKMLLPPPSREARPCGMDVTNSDS